MPFTARKHTFYRVKALLLRDKLNALTGQEHAFCRPNKHKRLAINMLQKRLILAVFRTKLGVAGEEGQNELGFSRFRGGFRL